MAEKLKQNSNRKKIILITKKEKSSQIFHGLRTVELNIL